LSKKLSSFSGITRSDIDILRKELTLLRKGEKKGAFFHSRVHEVEKKGLTPTERERGKRHVKAAGRIIGFIVARVGMASVVKISLSHLGE